MKISDYAAAIKAKTGSGTAYAAAKLLGVDEDTFRGWEKGTRLPDNYGCLRIAEVLDAPLIQVLADIERQREKNETKRQHWEHLSRKFAASVLIAGFSMTGTIAAVWPLRAEAACEISKRFTNYATRYLRRLLGPRRPGFALAPSR